MRESRWARAPPYAVLPRDERRVADPRPQLVHDETGLVDEGGLGTGLVDARVSPADVHESVVDRADRPGTHNPSWLLRMSRHVREGGGGLKFEPELRPEAELAVLRALSDRVAAKHITTIICRRSFCPRLRFEFALCAAARPRPL